MTEPSNRDEEWRRKHSLLALWQCEAASTRRNRSLLSIAVDDHDEADVVDPATLHRMARFCREEEPAGGNVVEAAERAAEPFRPELRTEAASAPEYAGDASHPQLPAEPADNPWQPAPSSATHLEPSAPASEIDEISESLREARNELNQIRDRRARRYF